MWLSLQSSIMIIQDSSSFHRGQTGKLNYSMTGPSSLCLLVMNEVFKL